MKRWSNAAQGDFGPEPVKKPFKKKNPEIPTLNSYEGDFDESYWESWTKVTPGEGVDSWIDLKELINVANEIGYVSPKLDKAKVWLSEGVKLGVNDEDARKVTSGPNSKLALELGERVSDSLQAGIKQGYIKGPLTAEDLEEAKIFDIKTIPLSCRLKPNGQARLILDGSFPHFDPNEEIPAGTPRSMNSGIRVAEWPSRMITYRELINIICEAGRDCCFLKLDWQSAYSKSNSHINNVF